MKTYATRETAITAARKLHASIEDRTESAKLACTVVVGEDGRHSPLWSMPADLHHIGMWLCRKGHATMVGASLPTAVRIELGA